MNGREIIATVLGSFSFELSPRILWVIFAIVVSIFGVISAILLFHWKRYGMNNARIVISETIYLIGGGVFILIALLSILNI